MVHSPQRVCMPGGLQKHLLREHETLEECVPERLQLRVHQAGGIELYQQPQIKSGSKLV